MSEAKESKIIRNLSSNGCREILSDELAKSNPSQENITECIARCAGTDLSLKLPAAVRTNKEKRNAAIKMIAQGLEGNPVIKDITASFLSLDDDDARVLASLLGYTDARATKIISLNLAYNEIGDEGVQVLATMLRTNKTLHTLDLYKNPAITKKGWRSMEDVLLSLENITLLSGNSTKGAEYPSYMGKKIHEHFNYLITGKYEQAAEMAKIVEESLKIIDLPSVLSNLVFGYTGLERFKKFEKKEELIPLPIPSSSVQNKHLLLKRRELKQMYVLDAVYAAEVIGSILMIPLAGVCFCIYHYGADELAQYLAAGTVGSAFPHWATWTVSIATPIVLILLGMYLRNRSTFQLSDTELYEMSFIQEAEENEVPSGGTKAVI